MEAMIEAVGDDYEVSEIEGDAILLIRKGSAPSKKEIQDTCIKIFNAFHFRRKWMQLHTICPCGACQAIINLTLKFIVHHGPLVEIKVGKFVKQAGPEMIVAHRLLKNSIGSNEYLLVTEKLLQSVNDGSEFDEMEWQTSSEEYSSIGKVNYEFALLNEARKKVPEPPTPEYDYRVDTSTFLEMDIPANFFDVYMILKDIPNRPSWVPGLLKVEQQVPEAFVGSIHNCIFEDYEAILSPIRMTVTEEGIVYAESLRIVVYNVALVYEYVLRKSNENTCLFGCRFFNGGNTNITNEINQKFLLQMQLMVKRLKEVAVSLSAIK